jgi:hypothetical protein
VEHPEIIKYQIYHKTRAKFFIIYHPYHDMSYMLVFYTLSTIFQLYRGVQF